jgi:hypothetical protein
MTVEPLYFECAGVKNLAPTMSTLSTDPVLAPVQAAVMMMVPPRPRSPHEHPLISLGLGQEG